MANYPDSKRGFLMKGALIELKPSPVVVPIPSITIFQYNPASLSRTITPTGFLGDRINPPATQSDASGGQPATPGRSDDSSHASRPDDPKESFNLKLVIDAFDDLNDNNKLGLVTGVADRLASLEMLTYPDQTLLEQGLDALGDAIGGALGIRKTEKPPMASVQLFYFGPGKLVPIKITSMTVDEQQFHSTTLYPTRAEVTLGIEILREAELDAFENTAKDGPPVAIARGCYLFTREQKSLLSLIGGPIRMLDAALTGADPDLGDIL
jgi:hypothetical protein